MPRKILFICLLLYANFVSAIDGRFDVKSFFSPSTGSYIETHLSINARGVTFKQIENKKLQSTVLVQYIILKDTSIIRFEIFKLYSPQVDSLSQANFLFSDLQRFAIEPGEYAIEIKLVDAFDSTNVTTASKNFTVKNPNLVEGISFSDMVFVHQFSKTTTPNMLSKHGLDLVPYTSSFFPESQDSMRIFFEVYNLNSFTSDSLLIVRTYIAPDKEKAAFVSSNKYTKLKTNNIGVVFDVRSINELPTGNYRFCAEVLNKKGDTLAYTEKSFQRLSKGIEFSAEKLAGISLENSFVNLLDDNSVFEAVRSLRPISDGREQEFLDRLVREKPLNYNVMRKFLISFWERKDKLNPEESFKKYQNEVAYAQTVFGTRIKRGHETDRGRVMLQYGKPDSRTSMENEPSALPYEIWWYYQLGNQSNVRFVFYAQSLAINDYQLLHSEAFGEPNNPNWRLFIFQRTTPFNNIDEDNNRGHYGSQVDPYFRNN